MIILIYLTWLFTGQAGVDTLRQVDSYLAV